MVADEMVYLVDDSNCAVLPEGDGTYGDKLNDGAHYKVVGTTRPQTTLAAAPQAVPQAAPVATASTSATSAVRLTTPGPFIGKTQLERRNI